MSVSTSEGPPWWEESEDNTSLSISWGRGVFVEHTRSVSTCNGKLNLTDMKLTELPPLSHLIELRLDKNDLITLPPLPSRLLVLTCHRNHLISLPPLPKGLHTLLCSSNQLRSLPTLSTLPSLRVLECDYNLLTTLPELPASLQDFTCGKNRITSLPPLPNLIELDCSCNQLHSLPPLPASLRSIDCTANHLHWLPELPERLCVLYCKENPLEIFPELPRDLGYFMGEIDGDSVELENTNPEVIQVINTRIGSWTKRLEEQSKKRCMARCAIYKEEIMMTVWHPTRMAPLIERGIDLEDIM